MRKLSFTEGTWLNRPQSSAIQNDELNITTDAKTDFWRETYYGFTRDTGHALLFEQPNGFTAELRIQGRYEQLYDQAGVMVRLDDERWIKSGVEFTDGQLYLSTVVTDVRSDWSVTTLPGDLSDIRMRVTVTNGSLRIQASLDGTLWPLLRLAPFPVADRYLVGPMAATPERSGFQATFSDLRCGPPSTKDLHDWS